RPLLAALILTLVPMILAKMPDAELPGWLGFASLAGVFVGLLLCGIYAALTDTLSAKIMRFAAWGALTVVAVTWLVNFFAGGALGRGFSRRPYDEQLPIRTHRHYGDEAQSLIMD